MEFEQTFNIKTSEIVFLQHFVKSLESEVYTTKIFFKTILIRMI